MSKIKVYDKVSWHFPEGRNCPNIDSAKKHFKVIMEWLKQNSLLNEEGMEQHAFGIDDDFSITSSMLTEQGNQIFEKHYSKWLKTIDYFSEINVNEVESYFKK